MEKQKQQPQRLQSLDALRGFDMLFIMGGASLFVALATLFPNPFFQAIAGQMEHVEWNGLAHHDTIFPLFLFIAGISFPFSLEKQRGKGMTEGAIYKKIDRVYYLLYIWKQLGFEQERDELHLTGDLNDKELLLPELRKFIRQVFIMNPATNLDLQAITLCE